METLNSIVTAISDVVWFPILVVSLVGLGIFSSIYLGLPQFTRIGATLKQTGVCTALHSLRQPVRSHMGLGVV
mgnify:CR=1 FL=1